MCVCVCVYGGGECDKQLKKLLKVSVCIELCVLGEKEYVCVCVCMEGEGGELLKVSVCVYRDVCTQREGICVCVCVCMWRGINVIPGK